MPQQQFSRNIVTRLDKGLNTLSEQYWPEKPGQLVDGLFKHVSDFTKMRKDSKPADETVSAMRFSLCKFMARILPALRLPSHEEHHHMNFRIGQILAVLEMLPDSLYFLSRAIKADPENAEYNRVMNIVAGDIKKQEEKKNATAECARLYKEGKRSSKEGGSCVPAFKKAVDLAERHNIRFKSLDAALRHLAQDERQKNRNAKTALPYALRAYQIKPRDFNNMQEYGLCLSMSGEFQKAAEILTAAYRVNPAKTRLVKDIDLNYRRAGEIQAGYDFIQAQLAKSPEDPVILEAAALHAMYTKKKAEARGYIDRIRAAEEAAQDQTGRADTLLERMKKRKKPSAEPAAAPSPEAS